MNKVRNITELEKNFSIKFTSIIKKNSQLTFKVDDQSFRIFKWVSFLLINQWFIIVYVHKLRLEDNTYYAKPQSGNHIMPQLDKS